MNYSFYDTEIQFFFVLIISFFFFFSVRKGNEKPENAGCRLKVLAFQNYKNVKK